jgi:hypothetical protein
MAAMEYRLEFFRGEVLIMSQALLSAKRPFMLMASDGPVVPAPRDPTMPSTSTQILALPICAAVIETGNNEDWVDSILFLIDNGSGDQTTMQQLDLRGIDFIMEIRRAVADNEVIIHASTLDFTMAIGAQPNFGYLLIYVPLEEVMQYKAPGQYVGDIVAMDSDFTRRVINIDLTIVEGVTR